MADNLPLIPAKESVCSDVQPVLRCVFRSLQGLPPLIEPTPQATVPHSCDSSVSSDGDHALSVDNIWTETYKLDCKELWEKEDELKEEHAKRLARAPPANAYTLQTRRETPVPPQWRIEKGILQRRDLVPAIEQDAGRDASLWVKNILNRSSGDLSKTSKMVCPTRQHPPVLLGEPSDFTMQTLSIGEVLTRVPPPPPPEPAEPPLPKYIVCIPPQLDFINFSVGQIHSQTLRFLNLSKFEVRLSVLPPERRELSVHILGARGLSVSAGAAAELRVLFQPKDVRTLRIFLHVRVSRGQSLAVPISCYMMPPVLHITLSTTPSPSPAPSIQVGDMQELNAEVMEPQVLDLGSRLLGDVHSVCLDIHCDAEHASFFLLAEESWLFYNLDCMSRSGSVVAGAFAMWPAWWAGGGLVKGGAWCLASSAGLQMAPLRLLSSTAVPRPLLLLADVLLWRPQHLKLHAQPKDYDIMSQEDSACEYYVHLGCAFPNRALSVTLDLVNNSPVEYTYHWRVRPWGVCSCLQDRDSDALSPESSEDTLCIGAKEALLDHGGETMQVMIQSASRVVTEPERDEIPGRTSKTVTLRVPDVGLCCGTQRAVLMLIVENIPKESIPPDVDAMIVSTRTEPTTPIPGIKSYIREVCDVVCSQLEVWWEVIPARFVLDPPILHLLHSRRLKAVDIQLRGTQLAGISPLPVDWTVSYASPAALPVNLNPSAPTPLTLRLPLPRLPPGVHQVDVISAVAPNKEWQSQSVVIRSSTVRHLALRPPRTWLGVVPPGSRMHTALRVHNDTYLEMSWRAEPFRWWGERLPKPVCAEKASPVNAACPECRDRSCSCTLLRPTRGDLPHSAGHDICYSVNAPDSNGCVVTLVRVASEVEHPSRRAPCEGRAALVGYRVLAPHLLLRVLPCHGNKETYCDQCRMDGGTACSQLGSTVLRPSQALSLARRSCYRLCITNTTPIATELHWQPQIEGEEFLKIKFIPNEARIRSYGQVEIQVVLEAVRVCGRRVFVRCANVSRAPKPVYLIVDTAVAGLEVTCEVPLGAHIKTDSFIIVRRTQKEEYPWDAGKPQPTTVEEIFEEDDRKRKVIRANICQCPFKMEYIPPVKRPVNKDVTPTVEIVTEPPSFTRVCACFQCAKPVLPEYFEPLCVQFRDLPLRTVRSRTMILRNESVLTGRWTTAVRRWPRHHKRTPQADQWSGDVHPSGVVVQCEPTEGVLGARAQATLTVSVFADSWGMYYEQILIKITDLDPIVIDVWIEAVGPPLQLALKPGDTYHKEVPHLWMSASDPKRILRAKNTSRSDLTIHSYVLQEHGHLQDSLPFRLYLRFFDVLPRTCSCLTTDNAEEQTCEDSENSSYVEEMDTGVEVYLAEDMGLQMEDINFKVTPEVVTVASGETFEWKVNLEPPPHLEVAPTAIWLMRILPVQSLGPWSCRPEPRPVKVKLVQTIREGLLKASCSELRVRMCALRLPHGDVMKVRKRFSILNVGTGPLELNAKTYSPWSIVLNLPPRGDCGCISTNDQDEQASREDMIPLYIEARTSIEICVEVSVRTSEVWPKSKDCDSPPKYEEWERTTTQLHFYDSDNVLLMISLVLEIEFPIIHVEPSTINFGFVPDGDTRKTYFTVSHSSKSEMLSVELMWEGDTGFQLWPHSLDVTSGTSERAYLQYTAVWRSGPADGKVRVRTRGSSGGWCSASLPVRASHTRERRHALAPGARDHTDDTHLLPPSIALANRRL